MGEKKVFTAAQAKKIGEQLGIKWDKYDVEQFRMGMDVELEHGRVDPHTNVTNDDPTHHGQDRAGAFERVRGLLYAPRKDGRRSRSVLGDARPLAFYWPVTVDFSEQVHQLLKLSL